MRFTLKMKFPATCRLSWNIFIVNFNKNQFNLTTFLDDKLYVARMLSACRRITRPIHSIASQKCRFILSFHWLLSSLNCDKSIFCIDRFYINQCACKIELNPNVSCLDSCHGCIYNDFVQIVLMLINFYIFTWTRCGCIGCKSSILIDWH